jgi:hypothetical protein
VATQARERRERSCSPTGSRYRHADGESVNIARRYHTPNERAQAAPRSPAVGHVPIYQANLIVGRVHCAGHAVAAASSSTRASAPCGRRRRTKST